MQRNFIQKIGDLLSGRSAEKGLDFSPEIPNNYVQLMDGTHTYNMEMDRLNMFFGGTNISEIKNFKWYYENVPFLADCINIYADMASQVQILQITTLPQTGSLLPTPLFLTKLKLRLVVTRIEPCGLLVG